MKKVFASLTALLVLSGFPETKAQDDNNIGASSIIEAMLGSDPSKVVVPYDAPYGDKTIVSITPSSINLQGIEGTAGAAPVFSVVDHDMNVSPHSVVKGYELNWGLPTDWKETFCTSLEQAYNNGYDHGMCHLVVYNLVGYKDASKALTYYVYGKFEGGRNREVGFEMALPCIYNKDFMGLVYKNSVASPTHDNPYENKNKRQRLLSTLFSAVTSDYDQDGNDDLFVFYDNMLVPINGWNVYGKPEVAYKDSDGYPILKGMTIEGIPYSLECFNGSWDYQPNTWTSVKHDFDGDGIDDVLGLCVSANNTHANTKRTFYAVYLPGGDWTRLKVKKISTRIPEDMGHFIVPKAEIIYPHGKSNSEAYVALAWQDYKCPVVGTSTYNNQYTRVAMLKASALLDAVNTQEMVDLVSQCDIAYPWAQNAVGLGAPALAVGYPLGFSSDALLLVGNSFYTFDENMAPVKKYTLDCLDDIPVEAMTANMRTIKNVDGEDAMLNSSTFAVVCMERDRQSGETTSSCGMKMKMIDFATDGTYVPTIQSTQTVDRNIPLTMAPCTPQGVQLQFTKKYFTASNPIIKYVMAIPPYNSAVSSGKATVQCDMAQSSGVSSAVTQTRTASSGASTTASLAGVLKLGADMDESVSFSKTSAENYNFSWSHGYNATENNNVVVLSYIPAYVYEYEVVGAPSDRQELMGEKVSFLQGSNSTKDALPEAMWTVDSYNKYAQGSDLLRIGHELFPHNVGSLDNYRRTSRSSTTDYVRSLFPVKENGFFALGPIVTTGDGGTTSTSLSISDGGSSSQGESHTLKNGIKFSVGLNLKDAGIPVTMEFGASKGWSEGVSWTRSESWSSTVKTSGTVPSSPNDQTYSFREVWYEYADPASGQNFMVTDWVLVDYTRVPVSVNLKMLDLYSGIDDDGVLTCMPCLNWSSMSNEPIDRCVLEYKIDGVTPTRNYEDATATLTLDETIVDWTEVDKNWAGTEWVKNEFTPDSGQINCMWEFFDLFSLTSAQTESLKRILGVGKDVKVYYRVRVEYGGPAQQAASSQRRVSSRYTVYSNEVSGVIISNPGPISTVAPVGVDVSSYPEEIYTLQGIRVDGSLPLAPGVYIRRQGPVSSKILVR